jgi:predicted PurR-regulated permease PerM
MMARGQLRFWLIGLGLFVVVLYLLRGILLPFVAGMAIAYFLDPLCDWLETHGCSRNWATVVVSIGFVFVLVIALLFLVPLLERQILDFAGRLPGYVDIISNRLLPQLQDIAQRLGIGNLADLRSTAGAQVGAIVGWIGAALVRVVSSGVALANLLSLLFITPVVAFYLLRDWDRLVIQIDALLPRRHRDTIHTQLLEINRNLAGFARGQATVCLVLAIFYATGLSLIGLEFGLVVGLGIGFLSFIPYVGSITGLIVSLGIALAQFPTWGPVGLVLGFFVLGQILEGYVLTPRLVGNRVGLHPVWVIFALLAGGALFGFVGLLLAVPVAAVIGVLIRFAVVQYRDSRFFRGDPPWPSSPSS